MTSTMRRAMVVCLWALCLLGQAVAGDVVIVVDTSGSMQERISKTNRNIRIKTVQEALAKDLAQVEPGTRLYLISFSSGINSEMESILRVEADREAALGWVSRLADQVRANATTHLWASLRRALQVATTYSEGSRGQTVRIRVLTDGMDNDPKYRRVTPTKAIETLAREFPLLDGKSIRANLVLLGDLEMELKHPGVVVEEDPEWIVSAPRIDWTPRQPRVGEDVRFSLDYRGSYEYADWWVDAVQVSKSPSFTHRFARAGVHEVRLVLALAGGRRRDATPSSLVVADVAKPEPLAPQFTFTPASPVPGEVVRLVGRATGVGLSYAWSVAGRTAGSEADVEWRPEREGSYDVVLTVTDADGRSEAAAESIHVAEPPLRVAFSALRDAASGQPVQFVNETEGRVVSWAWEFGDGSKSTERNPVHTFVNKEPTNRSFGILLTAKSPTGKTFAASPWSIAVAPEARLEAPTAAFSVAPGRLQAGVPIGFIDESTGLREAYSWDFAGEGTSSQSNPIFTFDQAGQRIVRLTVSGPGGTNTSEKTFDLAPRDLSVNLSWLGAEGQAVQPPLRLDFGQVHPDVLARGDFLPPIDTEFEVTMPTALPQGGGARIELDDRAGATWTLERRKGESYETLVLPLLLNESARFRLACKTTAPVGPHTGSLIISPQGAAVLLNGHTSPIHITALLAVQSTRIPPGLLLLLVLLAGGLLYWVVRRLRTDAIPEGSPVILSLREVPPPSAEAGDKPLKGPEDYTLHVGDEIGLKGPGGRFYDLNCSSLSLARQTNTFELRHKDGRTSVRLTTGKPVEFHDDAQQLRAIEIAWRVADDTSGTDTLGG